MKNNMTNPCGNLKKYGLPATLVGILAEHPATSGKQDWSFQVIFCCQHPRPPQLCLSSMTSPGCSMTYPANPNRPSSTGIGLSMCQDLQLNSAVFTATSSAIDAGGIHRGRRSLDPLKTTSTSPLRLSVALLSWCPKTYPVTWDVSHGVWQKYREFKGRIRSQTFAVKAEACFGYLNGQTSVQCELIVSHCHVLQSSLSFDSGRNWNQQKNLLEAIASCCGREWREKPIWQSQRPQRDITPQSYINPQTSPQAEDDTRVRFGRL